MDKKAFFANVSKLLKKIVLHKDNSCHYKSVDCRYLMKIPAVFIQKKTYRKAYMVWSLKKNYMNLRKEENKMMNTYILSNRDKLMIRGVMIF